MTRSSKKTVLSCLLLGCVCAILPGAAAPTPRGLEGEWRNTRNAVHLRIAPCGQSLCGTVIWADAQSRADAKKGSGKDLVGSRLLSDLQRAPDGTWRGKVYVPDVNRNASARVTQVSDHVLRVTGCSFAGIVCQTRHWHRLGYVPLP